MSDTPSIDSILTDLRAHAERSGNAALQERVRQLEAALPDSDGSISVGDISGSTAVAIGENIYQFVNQNTNLPEGLLKRLMALVNREISAAPGRNRETTFAASSEICPYLGLEAFSAESAQFFFGREALTEKLLGVLRGGCRFLAVFGPSGSGKSSVVQAGLLPALAKGRLSGSQKWAQVTIRPADDPFAQMKAEGLELGDMDGYLENHKGMERPFDQAQGRIACFVDQFEELFTLCADDVRERFARELAAALDDSRFLLVISMRDDFYSAFNAKAAPLAASPNKTVVDVPVTLERADLVAMIERPAAAVGLALEDGLTDVIIKDAATDGAARSSTLPLLEFALTQLWEQCPDGLLTHDAYQSIGGVTGSLARWADDAYSDLPKTDRPLAESLLTALVHLGDEAQGLPDTRRRRALAEFDEPTRRVIKHFADRRLLVTGGETVELVHDALVREWGRLQGWIGNNRRFLVWRQKTIAKYQEWKDKKGELLRGRELLEAQGFWKERPNDLHELAGYVSSSVRRQKRQSGLLIGAISAVVIIFAFLAFWGQKNAMDAQKQSQIALGRQLSTQAQPLFANGNSKQMTAVLLAIQSMKLFPNSEATQILHSNMLAHPIASMAHGDVVNYVTFSPDGMYVISKGGRAVRLWQAATGLEIMHMTDAPARYVGFSPDSKYVVLISDDNTTRLWDASMGKEIARLTYDGWINSIAFSPNGKYVVSGGCDQQDSEQLLCIQGSTRIWEVITGKEIARMTHDGEVFSVAFSPDGKFVISGSADGTVRVWEAATGKEIVRMTYDSSVTSVVFSPDGKYVVSMDNSTFRVWEVATGKEIARMTHDNYVSSVAFSPDGKYLVSAGNSIGVWEIATGKEIANNVAAFSPDGKYLASDNYDHTISVEEIATGKEIASMTHDNYYASSIAFSPDGKYLASGYGSITYIWEVATGEEIARMIDDSQIYSLAFSPDSKYVVSGSADGTVRIWETITVKAVARVSLVDFILPVDFSRDGKYVFLGDSSTIHVWEVNTRKEIAHMTHDDSVTSVTFNLDGDYMASGSNDNTARVWNVTTGKEIARMTHDSYVTSVAFSPDGKYVVSGSADKTARAWEATTGQEIARLTHDSGVESVTFSADGRYIVSQSMDDHVAREWTYRPEDLIANACSRVTRNLTHAEWTHYVGDALPYQAVCPNLPIKPEPTATPKP